MKLVWSFFLVLTFASASDFPAPYNSEVDPAAPMPADEAAAKMTLPPGFKATVYASEPDVQNPVGMAWDTQGRLWIAENYTYAERTKRFDLSLRDRVLIFEGEDERGHFKKRTVFTDNVQMLTSVETGRGGVWLMCPPQLLFIPDANADGVPDGPPQVMLDGFTVAEANYHNLANGLRWGPDGWLYGRCGHSCPGEIGVPGTPKERRIPIKGGLWRFHPEKKIFEMLTHGTTNPWGHDWDENGELFFINTVTGHLWHMMPGAHLVDSTAMQIPGIYEALDTIADHYHFDTKQGRKAIAGPAANDFGGGHAHIGMMIYQGNAWPEKYRGELFTVNMHGRRINNDHLERLGCGYVGRHRPDFMLSPDLFFRGIDLSTGPDGNVFVIDWSDIGECHESTGVHRTSGRIFKISSTEAAKPSTVTKPMCLQGNGKLQTLWKQYQEGKAEPKMLRELLRDENEHVRVWAIRLLTDLWPLDTLYGPRRDAVYPKDEDTMKELVRMANEDKSGLVRLVLASVLQRLDLRLRIPVALGLVKHAEDAGDANLPTLVWHGLAPVGQQAAAFLLPVAKASAWPKVTKWSARSLAEHAEKSSNALDLLLAAALSDKHDDSYREAVLTGVSDAWQGWRKVAKPKNWDAFAATFKSDETTARLKELSILFGDGRALDEVKKVVGDTKADLAARQSALKTLIDARPDDLRTVCEAVLEVRGMSSLAVRGLALFDDPAIATKLVQSYRKLQPTDRAAVMDVLVSRASFAKVLLANVGDGKNQLARTEINAFQARQIRSLNDEALTKQLTAVWGELREASRDKAKLMATWKAKLTPDVLAQANLSQGRALFLICAACHTLYGEGGKIGPDLTGSGRSNIDYLLENILDPSAVVPAEYRMSTITLKDGRVLTGMVRGQTDRALLLKQLTGDMNVNLDEIAKREETPVSIMPEGLLQSMNETQVRDLIAYLMSPAQVPMPK